MKEFFLQIVNLSTSIGLDIFLGELAVVGLVVWFWFKKGLPSFRFLYWLTGAYLILFLVQGGFYTYSTYLGWLSSPVSRYLLPPYNNWYFFSYSGFRFFLPLAVSLVAALVWWGILIILKKRSDGLWLDSSEAAVGLLTAFLVGWPNILVYWAVLFSLMVWRLAVANLRRQTDFRLAITWPMIIATLFTLALGAWLLQSVGLGVLKVVG